jgi:beta-N-acetylhexosaminidase
VVYPQIDSVPAGYSGIWLQRILREGSGYRGVIMSDDLGMKAACVAGSIADRYWRCVEAGCDLALVCRPEDAEELLAQIAESSPDATRAIASLYGECRLSHAEMATMDSPGGGEWRQWQESLRELGTYPGLTA